MVIVDKPGPSPGEAKRKPGHGRKALPANLRREIVLVDIPESEKIAIGGDWTPIGEEISEKLDYTPSSLFVRRTVRPKYVVRFASKPDELKIAELPPEALPKSKAAPGLVADVVVSKCVDHLPLYRQEQRYARQGVELSRSTLGGWLAEAAEVLTPLYLLLKARVLAAKVVHTDDTPIPVQDPTRDHCRTGRIWAYVSAGGVVYDATEDRCRDGPPQFLKASAASSSATLTPVTTNSSARVAAPSSKSVAGRTPSERNQLSTGLDQLSSDGPPCPFLGSSGVPKLTGSWPRNGITWRISSESSPTMIRSMSNCKTRRPVGEGRLHEAGRIRPQKSVTSWRTSRAVCRWDRRCTCCSYSVFRIPRRAPICFWRCCNSAKSIAST